MVFAPVTANTLGKMAHGIADNFLVTAYLSAKCPVFIVPAMDLDMFHHSSTQNNIDILRSFGNLIIEPQTGELASGLSGKGRMAEPENIVSHLQQFFGRKKDFTGQKVVVTAGPTHEAIDPVRFIGNRSSGLMGISIAEEAYERGASVTLISGPSALKPSHPEITTVDVVTAKEMFEACRNSFRKADVLIMAAAVADYTPVEVSTSKIKKKDDGFALHLKKTTDILEDLGKQKKKNQLLVGFALESDSGLKNAKEKLAKKNLDLIVLNSLQDHGAGFDVATNKVTIIGKKGILNTGVVKDKKDVAKDILDAINKLQAK